MNDINTYVQEVSAKLLIGEMSFDDYDNFLSQLESMGYRPRRRLQAGRAGPLQRPVTD